VPRNGTHPSPHPEPPADLASSRLPLVPAVPLWFRIYDAQYHDHPLYFGRSRESRFDAPAGEYGILYIAQDEYGAFIETLGRDNVKEKEKRRNFVTTSALQKRELARVEPRQPLRLVDLASGRGLARLGADGRLGTGDYKLAQRWALALFRHPEQPDGLLYRSRLDPDRFCAAIYDRAESLLSVVSQERLADPSPTPLVAKIIDMYGFEWVEDV